MIRPALTDSITATQRALRSADVAPGEVTAVLLVGGSSRTPLVAEMVSSALGRPVSVDAHPKHGVALGAAITAATAGRATTTAAPPPTPPPAPAPAPSPVPAPAPGRALLGAAAVGPAAAAAPGPVIPEPEPLATSRIDTVREGAVTRQAYVPAPAPGGDGGEPPPPVGPPPDGKSRRGPLLVAAGLVALAGIAVAAVLALGGEDDPEANASTDTTAAAAESTSTAPTTTATTVPPGPFVNIQNVAVNGDDKYEISYAVTGYTPDVEDPDALHIHFFLDTTDPQDAGINGDPPGVWELTDELNTYTTTYGPGARGAATQMCSAVATHDHAVYEQGTLTGNCVDLPA